MKQFISLCSSSSHQCNTLLRSGTCVGIRSSSSSFTHNNNIAVPQHFNHREFSSSLFVKNSFTDTVDANYDRLKSPTRSETVPNNRTPTHTIHHVINTINDLGRATVSVLFNEVNSRHPGTLVSKRHLKKLLTVLKRGDNGTAVQPLRGQLTNKRVSFEYKLTPQMKRRLVKPMKETQVSTTTTTVDSSLEDDLFNKTLEAVQKGN